MNATHIVFRLPNDASVDPNEFDPPIHAEETGVLCFVQIQILDAGLDKNGRIFHITSDDSYKEMRTDQIYFVHMPDENSSKYLYTVDIAIEEGDVPIEVFNMNFDSLNKLTMNTIREMHKVPSTMLQ